MGSTPDVTRHVRDEYDDLQDLFAAGEAVQGLLSHPGWRHLMAVVDREVSQIDHELDAGRTPLSQAEYAMKHGRRGGLNYVERVAHAIVNRSRDELAKQQERHEGAAEPVPEEV